MIRHLLELKQKLPFIWKIIESINGVLFRLFYSNRIQRNALNNLHHYADEKYIYRLLSVQDLSDLYEMMKRQNQEQFEFFKPHSFDQATLYRLYNNPSFIMFGVFNESEIVGYFFLRCFFNKKSFTGRFVDENYQGQGISKRMGKILHNIAWDSGFRVFGTASKNNFKSLNSYQSINNFKIIKELDNDFIYFEYLKSEERGL